MAPTIELDPPLRYTGSQPLAGEGWVWGCRGRQARRSPTLPELLINQRVIDVLHIRHHRQYYRETCDIPRDSITPDSHAINDLGIDSLDFLDIAFAIDKAFGIKLPLEQWNRKSTTARRPRSVFRAQKPKRPHRRTRRCQGGLKRKVSCVSSTSN